MKLRDKGSYKLIPTKLEAIITLSPPENVNDLWIFLRMLNSFCNFIPDLTQLGPNIHELLKKESIEKESLKWI